MLKEAFEWIKTHAADYKPVQILEQDGRKYTSRSVENFKAPSPDILRLSTLSGLCQFIKNGADKLEKDKLLIHIVDHKEVHLLGPLSKEWREREKFACVDMPDTDGFDFGRPMNHEKFVIGLQIHFQGTPHLSELLTLVGTMKAGKVQTNTDDGVSQTVETNMGVQLATEKVLPNPVILKPYRTFRDLDDQPQSKFLFRVHQNEDEMPKPAIYEADGGTWVIDAMQLIFEYLVKQDLGVEIIV